MANAEIEATLKKVADTQLVHARLMETNERKWDKRFETSQSRMERLERRTQELDRGAEHLLRATGKLWNVVEAHEGKLDKLESKLDNLVRVAEAHERRLDNGADRTAKLADQVRTTLASIDRLIKMLEDFARGRKRQNGHQQEKELSCCGNAFGSD